ncbi:rhomboid family-domain-containing protein, partial [Cladochytrium replicatum]
PYFSWVLSGIHIIMVLVSLIINFQRTGSPIETSPDFNPFIGPAPGVLISMGARFYPCMHPGTSLDGVQIQCPAGSVSATGGTVCTLAELCGFSGKPDQWYRLILPIFLHGGIVHLLLNLVFQLRTAAQLERDWGWWRVALIYFISGIAGFLFGASYSGNTPSVGASGALYGLIACLLLDLLQNWRIIVKPVTELIKLLFLIIISFGIGMLPFVDNFAHVGGFVTGLFAGLLLIPTIHFGKGDKWRKLGFRIASVPVLIAIYVFLIQSFVTGAECSWCKYVNCIPGLPWCAQKWGTA